MFVIVRRTFRDEKGLMIDFGRRCSRLHQQRHLRQPDDNLVREYGKLFVSKTSAKPVTKCHRGTSWGQSTYFFKLSQWPPDSYYYKIIRPISRAIRIRPTIERRFPDYRLGTTSFYRTIRALCVLSLRTFPK